MKKRNKQSGQAILEMAVILPVFVLVGFGLVDIQLCLQDVANVNYIVNEVARCEAIAGTLCSVAPNTPASYARLQAGNLHMKVGYLSFDSGTCDANSCTATISYRYHALGIYFPSITFTRTGTAALPAPPTGPLP
jgi:Flp pilus assembly protein TadG